MLLEEHVITGATYTLISEGNTVYLSLICRVTLR
jgi:hypothetical protein